MHEFERHGWSVQDVYLGYPMRHDEILWKVYANISEYCVNIYIIGGVIELVVLLSVQSINI